MIIIKVTYQNDTRRLAVESLMPFYALKQLVRNLFPALQQSDVSLKYFDDEGDLVSLSTDFELDEAHRQAQEQQQPPAPAMLRLQVEALERVETVPAVENQSSSQLMSFTVSDFKKDDETSPVSAAAPSYPVLEDPVASPAEPATAPASPPAPMTVSTTTDVPMLQLIESQLASAMKAISSFMESLHIDQRMTEMIADIHANMKRATTAAQESVLNPLSQMAKSKATVASDHLDKLKAEISKLKALLEVEFNKALDKINQLASSNTAAKKDVELTEVCSPAKPAAPKPAAPVQVPVPAPVQAPAPVQVQVQVPVPAPVQVPAPVHMPALAPAPEDIGVQLVQVDLQHLADMGFSDRARNLELLARYNGDVAQVIDHLLQ